MEEKIAESVQHGINPITFAAITFALALPKHKAALSLEHNPHKSYHQSVEQYEAQMLDSLNVTNRLELWATEHQRDMAIASNNLWVLQWYPETPVGSCMLWAYSLEQLLISVNEGNKGV